MVENWIHSNNSSSEIHFFMEVPHCGSAKMISFLFTPTMKVKSVNYQFKLVLETLLHLPRLYNFECQILAQNEKKPLKQKRDNLKLLCC